MYVRLSRVIDEAMGPKTTIRCCSITYGMLDMSRIVENMRLMMESHETPVISSMLQNVKTVNKSVLNHTYKHSHHLT